MLLDLEFLMKWIPQALMKLRFPNWFIFKPTFILPFQRILHFLGASSFFTTLSFLESLLSFFKLLIFQILLCSLEHFLEVFIFPFKFILIAISILHQLLFLHNKLILQHQILFMQFFNSLSQRT